jgi:hypothetical protein
MAYDIGYDAANTRPSRPGWETWTQIFQPVRRLARELVAVLKAPAPPAPPRRPMMVEDVMLRPTLLHPRADQTPACSELSGRSGALVPLALLNGALLIWRRQDSSGGGSFTLSVGLVLGGRPAGAAIMLMAFSFSR